MRKIILILVLGLFQWGAVTAVLAQPEKLELAGQIMEKSGMNAQIRQLPRTFITEYSQRGDNLSPEIRSLLEREIVKAMDPERILREIAVQTESNLDVESMRTVLAWLESDLGQKITDMENRGATPEAQQRLTEFALQLKKKPASKKRSDLVQRFIKAGSSVEIDVDMEIAMFLAFATAINSILPEEKRNDIGMLKKSMEKARPKLRKESLKRLTIANLFTYRTLNDDEFRHYVDFAESESGKRYHRVTFAALKAAMERVFGDIAKVLEEVLKKISFMDNKFYTGNIIVHMKNGGILTWNNYMGRDDWSCTWLPSGEFCVKKDDIASVEPR